MLEVEGSGRLFDIRESLFGAHFGGSLYIYHMEQTSYNIRYLNRTRFIVHSTFYP